MTKRVTQRLTAQEVKAAKQPGYYCDGGGLYLQVSRFNNSKSWVFRYKSNGRSHDHGLGPLALVSLPEARDKAIAARKLLLDNIDPIETKRAAKRAMRQQVEQSITFGEAAKRYIKSHRSGWRNAKHGDQWIMTLLGVDAKGKPTKIDYCKSIRDLPVAEIETAHVMRVLSPIWNSKNETATRIRSRIEAIMNWSEAHGFLTGKNPARWAGNLDHLLPAPGKVRKVQRQPALPYRDVPAFVKELRGREEIGASALEFLILTAVRPGNVVKAKWSQIDFQAATWTIPALEMKSDAEHVVPLSKAALAILDRVAAFKVNDKVFSNGKVALSDDALGAVIARMNEAKHWIDPASGREIVPHGFRSSFRDWAAEHGIADAVAEACLAHIVSDKVVAAYRRTKFDELRGRAMAEWASFIERSPIDRENEK